MHRLLVAASAAAFLVTTSLAALAAEATGVIASIDATAGTVTLESGETFVLPEGFDTASLEVGQEVVIEYEEADGAMNAMSVEPAAE